MNRRTHEPEFVFRLADGAEPRGDVLSALADLLIDLKDQAVEEEGTEIHFAPIELPTKKPRTTGTRGRMPPSQ
jgi:hypothetical protein